MYMYVHKIMLVGDDTGGASIDTFSTVIMPRMASLISPRIYFNAKYDGAPKSRNILRDQLRDRQRMC